MIDRVVHKLNRRIGSSSGFQMVHRRPLRWFVLVRWRGECWGDLLAVRRFRLDNRHFSANVRTSVIVMSAVPASGMIISRRRRPVPIVIVLSSPGSDDKNTFFASIQCDAIRRIPGEPIAGVPQKIQAWT